MFCLGCCIIQEPLDLVLAPLLFSSAAFCEVQVCISANEHVRHMLAREPLARPVNSTSQRYICCTDQGHLYCQNRFRFSALHATISQG